MKSTTEIDFRKKPFIAQIVTWRYNKQIIQYCSGFDSFREINFINAYYSNTLLCVQQYCFTVMNNDSTNINKTNNHLSS
jgi:hypothetical protein